jgi:DNA primase
LPEGKDPDDLVRSGGRAAVEGVLARAIPLVDLLWQSALAEKSGDTPEARAAVRARLFAMADSIADRDIAAHYRHAFRERLDEAFFQRRQPAATPRPAPRTSGAGRGWKPPEPPPSPGLRGIGRHVDARHVDAIVAGLLRHPDAITRHADELATLPIADAATRQLLIAIIDIALTRAEGLDSEGLLTILGDMPVYNRASQLLRADLMQFSFTRPAPRLGEAATGQDAGASRDRALRDLDEAIAALIAWPEVERALADATTVFRQRLDADSFEEQQRLLRVKADLAERLASLGDSTRN